ncbi:MAG TPA: DJ-1/PfpI family protein [Polyangiaceae bacterium]|nr:DJ-1/PfpI family protein [Polyangiaceae bacterium]
MRTKPYSLAVIAFDEMDLLDVAGPLEVFSTAGRKWNWRAIKAELVSSTPAAHATRAQLQIGPAAALDSCPAPELLLIPGGYGARLALQDQALLDYLANVREGLTLTLAVGQGTLLAARAGLLRGAEIATTQALSAELVSLDPSITPRVESRPLVSPRAITVAQNGAAIELGLEVVARLLGKGQATRTARELGYAWETETLTLEIKS